MYERYSVIDILVLLEQPSDTTSSVFCHYSRENISAILSNFPVPTSFLLFMWESVQGKEQIGGDKRTFDDYYRALYIQWEQLPVDAKNV